MANNRIQFSLDFARGDTSALQGLKKDIAEIQKLASDIDFTADLDPNQLKSMVSAAQALDKALNNAFDVDLNTINVDKFNKSLAQSGFNAKSLQSALNHCGITGQQAFLKATAELMKFGNTAKQTNKFLDGLATSFLNTARWSAVSSIINNISGTIQNSFSYIKGLDTSLNDIRIVTGKSADEMSRFATEANNAAKSLAVSTRDYTEGSLIYYQQGLDDQTVKTLTDITAKTSNVTGQGMDEVSEQLTAVWNGYQVANEAAKEGMSVYEEYVDKMAAVGAATASDLQELSVAMSKVASAASSMGVGFDDLNAQIATIVSVTRQAPESVGTALKTIYARLGDLKVDGVDEFGVSLGKIGEQMAKMGIQILDTNGDMRDMTSIMTEVAQKWDDWSSAQKQAAAIAMAGKRQYNNLVALFENWDMYGEALNTSMNAAGTLEEQQEIALDSLANKMEILKATAEDLYDSLFDDSSLKGLVEAGTTGLQLLADLTDGLGGLKTILPMLGSVFLNVFNQQIGSALSTVVNNIKNTNKEIDSAKQNAEQLQMIFSGNQLFEDEGNSKAQEAALKDLTSYYNEMQQFQGIMTAQEKEQYNLILETKVAIGNRRIELEQEEESWNQINNKLQLINGVLHENDESIRQQSKNLLDAANSIKVFRESNANIDPDNFYNEYLSSLNLTSEQLENIKERFLDLATGGKTADQAVDQLVIDLERIGGGADNIIRTTQALDSEAEASRNAGNALREQKNIEKEIGDFSKFLGGIGQVTSGIMSLINLTKVWNDETTSASEKVTQTMLALTMTIPMIIQGFAAMKAISIASLGTMISGMTAYIAETVAAIAATESLGAALMATPVGWIIAALAAVTLVVVAIVKEVDKLSHANEKAAKEAEQYAKQMSNAYTQIADAARNARTEIENYYDAQNALGELTTGTEEWRNAVLDLNNQVTALIDKYPELAKGLDITNGVMSINEETLENFIKELQKQQSEAGLMAASAKSAALPKTQTFERESGRDNLNDIAVGGKTYSLAFNQGTSYTENEKNNLVANGTYDESVFIEKSESISFSLDQYGKLIDLIKKEGEEVLQDQERIAKYLSISADDAQLIAKDQEVQSSLMQQVNKELSEEIQLRSQRNAAISQYLTTNAGDEYQKLVGSEDEEDQSIAAAVNYAVTKKLSANSRRVTEELKVLEEKNDDQIEELWAEQLNYKKNDKGKYEDSEGKEVEFDAETAKQQLAEVNAAEKLVERDLGSVINGVKTAMNNLDESYKEGLNEFLQGGGTDNLSAGLRKNILEAAEFDVTGDTLQRLLGLSDEDLNALGYKSGKTFKDALINAINESDTSLEAFKNQLSQGAKDAINDLPSYFGAGQSNADIKQLYSNLDEANEVGGSVALGALTEKFSEGSTSALEFSNAIKDIDWASFNNVNDAVDQLERQGVVTDKDREIVKAYADQMILAAQSAQVLEEKLDEDVNEDEYKALVEHFSELGEEIEGVSEDVRDNQEVSEELAEELLRYDSALEDIIDGYDEWKELLDSDNIQDNAKAVSELRNTYSDLLDLDPSSLSEGFLSSKENLDLLKEAANGSEEAYNSLAAAAAKDILIQCGIDTTQFDADAAYIQSYLFDDTAFPDLEVGAGLNDEKFLAELTNMINAAGMTAQQATDYLSSMGVDAEIETTQQKSPVTKTVNSLSPEITYDTAENPSIADDGSLSTVSVQVPRITYNAVPEQIVDENAGGGFSLKVTSANKSSGGNFKFKNSSHGGGSAGRAARKPSGGGRKGGGGKKGGGKGKEKEKKDKQKSEYDRYYKLNNAIDSVTRQIDKLRKAEENLTGVSLAKKLEKETGLLNKQIKAYKNLAAEQKKETKEIKNRLKKKGGKFDEDGNLTNYKKLYDKELKAYNAAIDKYNASAQEKADKKALEKAEKRYEKFKQDVEKYEETKDAWLDTKELIKEVQLEKKALKLEAWDIKLQVKLDKKQFKRDLYKFVQDVQDDFKMVQPDLVAKQNNNKKQWKTYIGKNGTLSIDEKRISDIQKEIDKLEAGKESKMFASLSKAKEALQEAKETYMDDIKAFNDLRQETWDTFLEGIDQATDQFDTLIKEYDRLNDELAFQKELIELIYGPEAYDLMESYYNAQEKASTNQVEMLRKQADMWEQQWINSGAKDKDRFEWTQEQQAYYDKWQEAESQLNDKVLEHIKLLKEDYVNAVKKTVKDLEKLLTGGSSLSEVKEGWERISAEADKYYDSVEKAYEIQTLSNKMDKEIASTKDLKAQQKLKQIRDEEIELLREKDKLTEYDLKRAEAKYNIALKEIALENSKNNKKSMKLTRNEQGNWSYQYVADLSDVENKQQDLLDAVHNLYELSSDAYEKNLEQLMDLNEKYLRSMEEIANDEILTEEEKTRKLTLLKQNYEKDYNILAKENTQYRDHLVTDSAALVLEVYKQDQSAYETMTTEEQKMIDALINPQTGSIPNDYRSLEISVSNNLNNIKDLSIENMKVTRDDWTSKAQDMADAWNKDNGQSIKSATQSAFNSLFLNMIDYKRELVELQARSKTTFLGEDSIKDHLDTISNETQQLNQDTDKLVTDLVGEDGRSGKLGKLREGVKAIEDAWIGVIDKAEKYLEIDINGDKTIGKPITEQTPSTTGITSDQPAVATRKVSEQAAYLDFTNNDKNNTKKEEKKTTTTETNNNSKVKGVAAAIWYLTNYGGWGSGTTRKNRLAEKKIDYNAVQDYLNGKNGKSIKDLASMQSKASKYKYGAFKTGGYTGEWGEEGRWAVLHQKELVLNKEDTKNFLEGINTIRDITSLNGSISNSIAKAVANMMVTLSSKKVGNLNSGTEENTSNVFNITAEFPNAENVNEIRQAILSLPNLASQYIANNKK